MYVPLILLGLLVGAFPARGEKSRTDTTFGLYGVPKMTLGMSDWTTERPWCADHYEVEEERTSS